MVGAGEVDEDLEVETKEECEKYGKVGKCVIELTEPATATHGPTRASLEQSPVSQREECLC